MRSMRATIEAFGGHEWWPSSIGHEWGLHKYHYFHFKPPLKGLICLKNCIISFHKFFTWNEILNNDQWPFVIPFFTSRIFWFIKVKNFKQWPMAICHSLKCHFTNFLTNFCKTNGNFQSSALLVKMNIMWICKKKNKNWFSW